MTDYSYRSNYRPLKDIEQDNNKLQVRNSALSGENSELKYQLDYANLQLKGNASYIAHMETQSTQWRKHVLEHGAWVTGSEVSELPREHVNNLMSLVDYGVVDRYEVIKACLKFMSEDKVKDMLFSEFKDVCEDMRVAWGKDHE